MSVENAEITNRSLEGNNVYHGAEGDPFIGEQETTDSVYEAIHTPDHEMVLEHHPVGRAVKSRSIAGILGVFLGGFGLHRFYLGYRVIGRWQLALTMSCFLVALSVAMLMGSDVDGAITVALGSAAIGIAWGFMEGLAIAMGGLSHDALGRPLKT